jgi:hypothetical protein
MGPASLSSFLPSASLSSPLPPTRAAGLRPPRRRCSLLSARRSTRRGRAGGVHQRQQVSGGGPVPLIYGPHGTSFATHDGGFVDCTAAPEATTLSTSSATAICSAISPSCLLRGHGRWEFPPHRVPMLLRAPTSTNLRSRAAHCYFKLRQGQGRPSRCARPHPPLRPRCKDGVGAPAVEQGGEPRLRRVGARPRWRHRPPRRPRASSSLGLPAAKSVRRWRLRILGVSIFYCARTIRRYGAREMEIVLGDSLTQSIYPQGKIE